MKKFIFISLILLTVTAFGVLSDPPQSAGSRVSHTSVQRASKTIATVTEDAAEPNFTEMTWNDSLSKMIPIPAEWGNISLAFYGYGDGTSDGDPCDSNFSYSIYFCDLFGGWERIVDCNGVIGAQKLSHDPEFGTELNDPNSSYRWGDTITEVTQYTDFSVIYSDNDGNDGLAKSYVDRHSAYGIYVRIYNMTSENVTYIRCIMNGFNNP